MFSLEIECDPDERDLLIAELWEQGSAGMVELDTRRVRAFFDDGANRDALLELFPGASFTLLNRGQYARHFAHAGGRFRD